MFRVLNCLTVEHDWRLVILAALVCFLASLAAISMFHRASVAGGRTRAVWAIAAGAATGCGIWATHFIAMLAYDPGIAIAYDLGRTALSLIAAVLVTFVGLAVAIYEPGRWSAPLGGAIVGGGVATMHYLGMSAVVLGGRIGWAPELVIASILFGIAFGAAALAIAKRGENARSIFAAALLLTLAIVSHHFTAMGAVLDHPRPGSGARSPFDSTHLACGRDCRLGDRHPRHQPHRRDRRPADGRSRRSKRRPAFTGSPRRPRGARHLPRGETIVDVNSSLERLVGTPARALTGKAGLDASLPVVANAGPDPAQPTSARC